MLLFLIYICDVYQKINMTSQKLKVYTPNIFKFVIFMSLNFNIISFYIVRERARKKKEEEERRMEREKEKVLLLTFTYSSQCNFVFKGEGEVLFLSTLTSTSLTYKLGI